VADYEIGRQYDVNGNIRVLERFVRCSHNCLDVTCSGYLVWRGESYGICGYHARRGARPLWPLVGPPPKPSRLRLTRDDCLPIERQKGGD
jgi:hypothetical protein